VHKELAFINLIVIQDVEYLTLKSIYEPVRLKPSVVADKSVSYIALEEKDSLGKFNI
jgi:hypothetical protein